MSLCAGLGLGLASYCLVLLISREASVATLSLMGITSLSIIVISMWLLWIHTPRVRFDIPAMATQTAEPSPAKTETVSTDE